MHVKLCAMTVILLCATITIAADSSFKGGFPTAEQSTAAHHDADFQRAVTSYRFWYPTVSCEGIFNGGRAAGVKDNEKFMIMACGPKEVAFTANSDTPYGAGAIDSGQNRAAPGTAIPRYRCCTQHRAF